MNTTIATTALDLKIPTISAEWTYSDIWNHIKLRWSIGRNNSKVKPGIYAIGNPTAESDVFVSASYKLSFNHLRKALNGLNAWILVLDTRGVNVWCAAGKGTFGTSELVKRLNWHGLSKVISHNRIIVPQLGATGISAHDVLRRSGYRVIYGPVRANDIKDFVSSGYKATPEMRRVDFPLWERIKLIPVELAYGKYYLMLVPFIFLLLSGLSSQGYSFERIMTKGSFAILNLLVAYLAGCVATPILLPYIPFKRFSLKGLSVGLIFAVILLILNTLGENWLEQLAWFLIIGSLSSFMAMNFTGSSTFTSLSGVKKEMKYAVPLQIAAASVGLMAWIVSHFI